MTIIDKVKHAIGADKPHDAAHDKTMAADGSHSGSHLGHHDKTVPVGSEGSHTSGGLDSLGGKTGSDAYDGLNTTSAGTGSGLSGFGGDGTTATSDRGHFTENSPTTNSPTHSGGKLGALKDKLTPGSKTAGERDHGMGGVVGGISDSNDRATDSSMTGTRGTTHGHDHSRDASGLGSSTTGLGSSTSGGLDSKTIGGSGDHAGSLGGSNVDRQMFHPVAGDGSHFAAEHHAEHSGHSHHQGGHHGMGSGITEGTTSNTTPGSGITGSHHTHKIEYTGSDLTNSAMGSNSTTNTRSGLEGSTMRFENNSPHTTHPIDTHKNSGLGSHRPDDPITHTGETGRDMTSSNLLSGTNEDVHGSPSDTNGSRGRYSGPAVEADERDELRR